MFSNDKRTKKAASDDRPKKEGSTNLLKEAENISVDFEEFLNGLFGSKKVSKLTSFSKTRSTPPGTVASSDDATEGRSRDTASIRGEEVSTAAQDVRYQKEKIHDISQPEQIVQSKPQTKAKSTFSKWDFSAINKKSSSSQDSLFTSIFNKTRNQDSPVSTGVKKSRDRDTLFSAILTFHLG